MVIALYTPMSFAHLLTKTFLLVPLVMSLESAETATSELPAREPMFMLHLLYLPPAVVP